MSKAKNWRMTVRSNGHLWGFFKNDAFECCQICGIVRRLDDKNLPCKGPTKLSLRQNIP